jgi:hypothetical protein
MIEALRLSAVQADPVHFWVFGAVVAVVSIVFLRRGLDAFWRLRTITDTPTARIRSAPQGYVELRGRVVANGDLVTAPLTRIACVWYRYKVQERRGSGRNTRWVTLDQGQADRPFLLEDETGRCLVEPAGADIHSRASDSWYGSDRHTARPQTSSWLQLSRRYRFSEERILPGEPVYLLGHFETPRRGPGERDRLVRTLLAQWKRDPARMARFDLDGDGEISLEEWGATRQAAEDLAEQSELRLQAEPPLSRMSDSRDARQPFIISTFGEGTLIGQLRFQAATGTAAFLVMGCGLFFALAARLTPG